MCGYDSISNQQKKRASCPHHGEVQHSPVKKKARRPQELECRRDSNPNELTKIRPEGIFPSSRRRSQGTCQPCSTQPTCFDTPFLQSAPLGVPLRFVCLPWLSQGYQSQGDRQVSATGNRVADLFQPRALIPAYKHHQETFTCMHKPAVAPDALHITVSPTVLEKALVFACFRLRPSSPSRSRLSIERRQLKNVAKGS